MPKHPRVAVLGDVHAPFQDNETIKQFLRFVRTENVTHVIQMGDMYDFYAYSRFPGARLLTAADELKAGRKVASEFWTAVGNYAPGARRVQLVGNHDIRPAKRINDSFPELAEFFSLEPILSFPGVHTHWDVQRPWGLDGVRYTHGAKSKVGQYVNYYKENYVCGHLHKAGTVYVQFDDVYAWEHNCGYAGDPRQKF